MTRTRLGLFFITFAFACATKSTKTDGDLDFKVEPRQPATVKKPDVDGVQSEQSSIPVDAVVQWQSFFKTPPTVDERKQIEMRLPASESTKSSSDLIRIARNKIALGRFAQAEADLRSAIRIDGKSLDAQLELAMLYLRRHDLVRSFEYLSLVREALSMQEIPDSAFVFRYRYTLAVAYIARGDRDDGHRVLSELIAQDKSFTPGYAALASSYIQTRKYQIAEFIAKRGIDRGKDDPSLFNILGVVAEHSGNLEAAEEWYTKAHSISPTFAPALINRAGIHIKEFDYDAAEEDLLRALMYQPNNVDGLVSLGVVHRKSGKFSAAKADFVKALDLDPENALARFNLAVLFADHLDRPSEAIRLLHEVVQTAGDNEELKATAKTYINNIKDNRESY